MSVPDLDETISLLYDAALDPAQWPSALAAVAAFGGADQAALSDFDYARDIVWRFLLHNISRERILEYIEKYAADDPRIPYVLTHTGEGMVSDHLEIDEDTRANHPVYRDYLSRHGIKECLGAKVGEEGNRVGILSLYRFDAELATEEQHAMLARLVPHVDRALKISRRFVELAECTRVGNAMLDSSHEPVAAVNRNGRVSSANSAFENLAKGADAFTLRSGQLFCHDADAQIKLMDALADAHAVAFRDLGSDGRQPFMLTIPRRGGRQLLATIAPILPSFGLHGTDAPTALLKLVDPTTPPSEAVLMQGFRLTPAEARLARKLVSSNGGLKETASQLGVSLGTVKSQLEAVYKKTGTSRQKDMVALLRSLPR